MAGYAPADQTRLLTPSHDRGPRLKSRSVLPCTSLLQILPCTSLLQVLPCTSLLQILPCTPLRYAETLTDLNRYALDLIDVRYANGTAARASTTRLQLALLKVALLLGVRVRTGARVETLKECDGYDVLLLASGFHKELFERFAGEATVTVSGSGSGVAFAAMEAPDRQAPAFAVVSHFEYGDRTKEAAQWLHAFEPFDWTYQDARGESEEELRQMQTKYGLFAVSVKQLEAEGLHLENVVCYVNQGYSKRESAGKLEVANTLGVPPSFYLLFTVRAVHIPELVLHDASAPTNNPRELLQWAKRQNKIDWPAVRELARRVAHRFTSNYTSHVRRKAAGAEGFEIASVAPDAAAASQPLSTACRLLCEADPTNWGRSIDVFDFTERKCLKSAAEVVTHVNGAERSRGSLLVLPVGDALQEPFWPEYARNLPQISEPSPKHSISNESPRRISEWEPSRWPARKSDPPCRAAAVPTVPPVPTVPAVPAVPAVPQPLLPPTSHAGELR